MLKIVFLSFATFFAAGICTAQRAENIIIVTTDGFRWQEVFNGMDSAIANNPRFNQGDSAYLYRKYWNADKKERRKLLLPFLWSTVAANGQLYGNRADGSKVNNANPYWFSYPGYSEILTGFADTAINSNEYPPNPNLTVLEYFNRQPALKGRVAAFGAWEAFDRIINEKRSGIPVMSAYDSAGGSRPNAQQKLINAMLAESYKPWHNDECFDVFTHYAALEELKTKKPRVLYIAYGETDEWAHSGHYRDYLDAAHQVDAWLKQLWEFVEGDGQYRGKTALFITTDHGRGDAVKEEWTSHGSKIKDAYQIWFAAMGPNVRGGGENTINTPLYQKQFAQTMARLMGYDFKAPHPVAGPIDSVIK